MKKDQQLVFIKSEFSQYHFIVQDDDIHKRISALVFKYISLEAFYKKMLIAEKEKTGKKLTQKEKNNLRVTTSDVKRVLEYFDIAYDSETIEKLFGSLDNNYMECSVKKLRDRLVHNANENVLRVIIERYDELDEIMNEFIKMLGC